MLTSDENKFANKFASVILMTGRILPTEPLGAADDTQSEERTNEPFI